MFDPATHEGIVVRDTDRAELVLATDALEGSIFRMLRQGQRVVFDLDADGRATPRPHRLRARPRPPHRPDLTLCSGCVLGPHGVWVTDASAQWRARRPPTSPTTASSSTAPTNATNIERRPNSPMPAVAREVEERPADQAAEHADHDRADATESASRRR